MQTLREQSGSTDATALVRLDPKLIKQASIYWHGQTLGFDGQIVHVATISDHSYVSSLSPVVGTGVAVFQPTSATVRDGVALQLKPKLDAAQKSVRLDIQSFVTEVSGISKQPVDAGALTTTQPTSDNMTGQKLLDRPVIMSQQLRSTVQIPLGTPVIVGGMTFDSDHTSGHPRQLYFVVEAEAAAK
jgi:hypothetical protein